MEDVELRQTRHAGIGIVIVMFENNDDDEEVFHGFYEDWITFHGRTLTRLVASTESTPNNRTTDSQLWR